MDLDDVVDIDARKPECQQDLDYEFVARGGGEIRRSAQPLSELLLSLWSYPKALLPVVLVRVVGLHQAVSFEALERGVHLADVERPHVTRLLLELLAELKAVLRALCQKRQKGVPDAHRVPEFRIILGILLMYRG